MRLSCRVHAARSLGCAVGAVGAAMAFARTLCLVFAAGLAGVWVAPHAVGAQPAPQKGDARDVLNAAPPTPELTELDEQTPTARPPATAETKRDASAPTSAAQAPTPPAAASGAGHAAGQPEAGAAAATPPAGHASSDADAKEPSKTAPAPAEKSGAANETSAPPAAPAAPPPPAVEGDFAGSSTPAVAAAGAPQEDFEAEPLEEAQREERREYSVRIDLLNWLLLGRLSFELEAGLWKFLSVQLTPVFVVAHSPIAINYAGLDDPLKQYSNGIGPISGVSLGVAAWLWGKPYKGYVLRLEITNYGYSYRTADAAGEIDRVDFTERRAILFIGSHSRFGAFTFAGGFGLGYELNQAERCGLSIPANSNAVLSRDTDCRGKQQIALDRKAQERADLNGPLHPVYFQARFSVGAVF